MATTGQDFTVYQGEDLDVTFTITGTDITGWATGAYFRYRPTTTLVLSKTSGASEITYTTPASGIGKVILTDTDTDTLAAGLYDWSLWRTDNGSERCLLTGTMTVLDSSR